MKPEGPNLLAFEIRNGLWEVNLNIRLVFVPPEIKLNHNYNFKVVNIKVKIE